MSIKIIILFIVAPIFSSAQSSEFKEFLLFKFDSSKEQVKELWGKSSLHKFGDLLNPNEDLLKIRIDDSKYFNGWQFFFIDDSLCKIRTFLKIASKDCPKIIDWLISNFGEPKINSTIYYWRYISTSDSSLNKISLSCSNLKCESIEDSARLIITIVNIKPYKRLSDLKANTAFLNGINNFMPGSSLEKINQQIRQIPEMELVPEIGDDSFFESSLLYRNGSVAGLEVDEWYFAFYKNKLYKIVIKFSRKAFSDKNNFYSILDYINASYGDTQLIFENNGGSYDWYFLKIADQDTFLGTIMLEQNKNQSGEIEVTLTFEYSRLLLMETQN